MIGKRNRNAAIFLAVAAVVAAGVFARPATPVADERLGGTVTAQGVEPAATFRAITGTFDADNDFVNTKVDTVTVMTGEVVRWQLLVGTHTVTSGNGSADPDVGLLFDAPLDPASPIFEYQFNVEGMYPFFCRPHEANGMFGAVRVVPGGTPTRSTTWGELKARNR